MGLGLTGAFGAAGAIRGLRAIEDRAIDEQERQAKAAQQQFLNTIMLKRLEEEQLTGGVNRNVATGGLTLRQKADAREGTRFGWEGEDRGERRAVLGNLQAINPSAYGAAISGVPEDAFLSDDQRMQRAVSAGRRQGASGQAAFDAGGRHVLEQTEGPSGIKTRGELRLIGARTAGDLQAARERAAIGRPPTGEQQKTLGFFNRMKDAIDTIEKVEDKLTDEDLLLINNMPTWTPELLRNVRLSDSGRQYLQAIRTYTEARLRKESGAAIPTSEYETDRQAIGRAVKDDPATAANKKRTRRITAEGLAFGAGPAYREFYGREFEPGELTGADRQPQLGPGEKLAADGVTVLVKNARGQWVRQWVSK